MDSLLFLNAHTEQVPKVEDVPLMSTRLALRLDDGNGSGVQRFTRSLVQRSGVIENLNL